MKAEKLAGKIEDVLGKTLSLCAIAGSFQKIQKNQERDRVLYAAFEFAKSAGDPKKRCLALSEVAAKQSDLGQRDAALKTFDLALESAGKIEDSFGRC
jgi:hypothetical protein